ncbi:unnamed protein product [Rhizophagus irregularis]|uniref:Uncharacterized protein n=1 Tax=Rhizophagus irregularis TaxID=588596 RepID=A0A916EDS6_9GLOM|nr:unnamed protein product [Rhizophagus irregularis]
MVSARLFALDWYRRNPFMVSAKPFHVSAKPFMYRRDPSLCIDIGWRGHLDGIGWDFWIGIISWKLGFLNKYRLEPLEMKPVVFSFCRSMAFWVFPEWNFEASQLFR